MRRAAKRDSNHTDIGDYLRSRGWSVLDVASLASAGCDFVVAKRYAVGKPGFAALVECKDGSLPPSARKLTENEQDVFERWEGAYIIALSPEDAETKLNAAMVRAGCCRMEDLA
jgi:hypothetical protein